MEHGNHEPTFPLPIGRCSVFREKLIESKKKSFIVCAMFTPGQNYVQHAERLAQSCERYSLPYRIYEVPAVHLSISLKGTADLAYTKANFIAYNFGQFPSKSILYVDVDVLFVDYPRRIFDISNQQYDIALYNWLNDRHNEAYVPVRNDAIGQPDHSEYYVYSHSIQLYCPGQLICSGGVQFYRNSPNMRMFLESWQSVIAHNPYSADDECLDLAYNNFRPDTAPLQSAWLDKSYLRMPWWPHVKPVILHPDLPAAGSRRALPEMGNQQKFYPERCQVKNDVLYFPQDYIIDTKQSMLLKVKDSRVVEMQRIKQKFWIYPGNV